MTTALATGRTGVRASNSVRILVVAGREGARDFVEALGRRGYEVHECESIDPDHARQGRYDLALVDASQLDEAQVAFPDRSTPIVVIGEDVPEGSPCVAALARGAAATVVTSLAALVAEHAYLVRRCAELEQLAGSVRDGSAFVGHSPIMRRLHGTLSRAADSEATVLIEGAPGSGKSLAGRVIHCKSRRGNRAIVAVDAGDLDQDRLQEALGRARHSTLLIEGVDQLPTTAQQLLVRVLKDQTQRGQDGAPRIVVTTSAHLPELVARGSFREDLYYRLHAYPIVIPGLRERAEDIGLLAKALLEQVTGSNNAANPGFTPAAIIMLESMHWPGNVAQLEGVVRRAFLAAGGAPIDSGHLQNQPAVIPSSIGMPAAASQAEEDDSQVGEDDIRPFDEEEQRLLSRALRATRGNVRRAAQLLGIGRATLYRKIQQYRLRLQ